MLRVEEAEENDLYWLHPDIHQGPEGRYQQAEAGLVSRSGLTGVSSPACRSGLLPGFFLDQAGRARIF